MDHAPNRSPLVLTSSSATPAPNDPLPGEVGWTPARQVLFLRALASTQSVARAARAAGLSRQSAYQLRARMKGEPFDLAWAAALNCRFDALAECALERAMHGVEVPHFYKGEMIATSRKFDERLTVALLSLRDRLAPPPRLPAGARRDVTPDFEGLMGVIESGAQSWDDFYAVEAEAREDEYAEMSARWGVKVEGEGHDGPHDLDGPDTPEDEGGEGAFEA
ncbi:MAG: hypothetical protein AAFN04_01115 [Pseudomonadota bacterium]